MWADAKEIDIREDGAYYKNDGKSYRDVFKNGLALEKTMQPLLTDYINLQFDEPKPVVEHQAYVYHSVDDNSIDMDMDIGYVKNKVRTKQKLPKLKIKKIQSIKHTRKCVAFENSDLEVFNALEKLLNEEKINRKLQKMIDQDQDAYKYDEYRIYDRYDYDNKYD